MELNRYTIYFSILLITLLTGLFVFNLIIHKQGYYICFLIGISVGMFIFNFFKENSCKQ